MKCVICGNDKPIVIWRRGRFNQELTNVVCAVCGLVYLDPRPELPDDFYEHSYRKQYVGENKLDEVAMAQRLRSAQKRFNYLKDVGCLDKPGIALEIGCGSGHFLKLLQESGWNVWGVDPDTEYTEYARTQLGLGQVRTEEFQSAEQWPMRFDLVALFHTLEHLDNPLTTLKEIRSLMMPGSRLVIEVPDIYRPYNGDLDFFFQSAHNFTFSPSSLRLLLGMAGFKVSQLDHFSNFIVVVATADTPQPMITDPTEATRVRKTIVRQRIGYWLIWKWLKIAKRLLSSIR